jgi:hypothetical protein
MTSCDSSMRRATSSVISLCSAVVSGNLYSEAPKYDEILEILSLRTSPAKKTMKKSLSTNSPPPFAFGSSSGAGAGIDLKTALPRVARKMTRSSDAVCSRLIMPATCFSIELVPAPNSESDMSSTEAIRSSAVAPSCPAGCKLACVW